MLLKDYVYQDRQLFHPYFKPILVAASDLSYTVKAAPPTKKLVDVASDMAAMFKPFSQKNKKVPLDILKDISFYLRPGEMTLILGAPGTFSAQAIPPHNNSLSSRSCNLNSTI